MTTHSGLLEPDLVLRAYALGIFPMADERDAAGVYWVEPRKRAILPLDRFRPSRSLRKAIASDRFVVTADTAFAAVVALCAEAASDRPETWINHDIERVFCDLHSRGYAHSVECWADGTLVGGLYGLALGRAFFGESMVSRATDASKVALSWLVARLIAGKFTLLDCQFQTPHLESMGAIEIDRDDYVGLLSAALEGVVSPPDSVPPAAGSAGFFALDALPRDGAGAATVSAPLSGQDIVQLLVQTS